MFLVWWLCNVLCGLPEALRASEVVPLPLQGRSTVEPLRVGATYYVTASLLNLRKQPAASGIAVYQVEYHTPLRVRELAANPNWVLVEFTEGDEGVIAYVSRWYLSDTVPNLPR